MEKRLRTYMMAGWAAIGLGAIVIPTIFYGLGFAWFGSRLREQLRNSHRHIVRLSASLLILTGTGNLLV